MKGVSLFMALVGIVIVLPSCKKKCQEKDDALTINKAVYTGTLRMDGYYYHEDPDSYSPSYSLFFLYKSGVVLQEHTGNLEKYEGYIGITDKADTKHGWGAFHSKSGTIRIEIWRPRICGYPVYAYSGFIINDTTFAINEFYRASNNENYTQLNDTFYFRQTTSKPDSTQYYL